MFTCLFLDTDDRRDFSPEARRIIHEVSAAAAIELRRLLPMLLAELELAMQNPALRRARVSGQRRHAVLLDMLRDGADSGRRAGART